LGRGRRSNCSRGHRIQPGRLGNRSKADALARQQVQAALIEVLTPICVDKFNRAENAQTRLVEFKKMTSSLDRERFVRENDWAKFGKESNSRVVDACATELYKL
jgi:hypothetical protein